MKKIFSFTFAAMAGLMLASCNGDYDDWKAPQGYDPEDPAAAYGVTAQASAAAANITMPVSDDQVSIVTFASTSDDVVAYQIRKLLVNGEQVTGTVVGNDVAVSADALEEALYTANNSRAQKTYPLTIDVEYGAVLSNGDAIAGAAQTTASFTTSPTPAIDAKGYYLLGNFEENGAGWDLSAPVWMTDEGGGIYSAVVNTTSDESNWFKFYEGSHYSDNWDEVNAGQMGCKVNGSTAAADFIVWTGDKYEVQTPVISGKGQFKVTIDMNNFTYKVVRQEYKLYLIGGPNDWQESAVNRTLKFNQPNLEVPYYIIVFPAAEGDTWFAIGDDAACDAIGNGDWSQLFGTTAGNGNSGTTGNFTRRTNLSDDGSFMVAGGTGKYIKVELNLSDNSYTVTPLDFAEYIYEIGNESGWSASHALRTTTFDGAYEGYYFLDGEFKFKPNADNWDGDWEWDGDGVISEQGQGNVPGVDAGFYRIQVNLANMTYAITPIQTVSIIGTVNGNWDTDTDLTYNKDENCWEVTAELGAGDMKFRGNHNWEGDVDLGGSFDALTHGGSNITIEAGTYNIKLYISVAGEHHAVVTKL